VAQLEKCLCVNKGARAAAEGLRGATHHWPAGDECHHLLPVKLPLLDDLVQALRQIETRETSGSGKGGELVDFAAGGTIIKGTKDAGPQSLLWC
jgi:hypothetical protein